MTPELVDAVTRWVRLLDTSDDIGPLAARIESEILYRLLGMSSATLHRHFKTATGMSPMRFQKHLRLHEARRQLIVGNTTAVLVAEAVGYGSATQFNREYRSFCGLPPAQDAARLRERMASTRS
jgi:transcriptional regulator GlxA family with amidase domain